MDAFDAEELYDIRWDGDHKYAGMRVLVAAMSIRETIQLDRITRDIRAAETQDEIVKLYEERATILATHLVEWNLTRNGELIPTTTEGIMSLSLGKVMAIVNEWMYHVTEIPERLVGKSTNGSQFPEASIPMESLSPSPSS